jgi:hypothetical protein
VSSDNPISVTDITYNTITNSINADPDLVDKPNWWKRFWAGVGDVLMINLNARTNNNNLRTAYTRRAVKDLLELIDYLLGSHETSSGVELFYVKTAVGTGIFPFTVQREDLAATSQGTISIASKRFEGRANETFSLVQDTFTDNYPTNNNLTVNNDIEYTGHKVRLTTTGTLPGGLAVDTDYYVIRVDATTIKLATSLENANAGTEITITAAGSGTHTLTLYSKAVNMYQQESKSDIVLGKSDGKTQWQSFTIPDAFFLAGTETIIINSVTWTRVTTFVEGSPTDKIYKIAPLSDNQFEIQFADGVYGEIPGEFDIFGSYAFGGGSDSNISSLDNINSYAGSDSNITGVTNATTFTGGDDEQSLERAKKLGPLLLKSRDRAVTTTDFEALALDTGGLSQVKANKNVYGVLSVQIVAVATGGGNPSSAKRTEVQEFLINRTLLESVDVRFEDGTITAIPVTAAAKILAGYTYADVEPFIDLAFKLVTTETGVEIVAKYEASGVQDTIDLINTIFGTSFDKTDQETATQIETLVSNLTPVEYGDTFQESDVLGYIDSFVTGLDYITVSVFGTGFPLALSSNEISTDGAISLSEIT